MRFCSPKRLWLALLLLSVGAGSVRGQWRTAAPVALTNPTGAGDGGAIHFKDGIIWAGVKSLCYSEDTGVTWNEVTALDSLITNSIITDISFCNKDTGIVATDYEMFQTMDRGKSWKVISGAPGSNFSFSRVTYNHSTNIIHAKIIGKEFLTSFDGGQNWMGQGNFNYGLGSTVGPNGNIFVIDNSTVSSSSDYGATWNLLGGIDTIDVDSYSIDVDSCDEEQIYLLNENFFNHGDGNSTIYASSDGGITWNSSWSRPARSLAGSLAEGTVSVFASTLSGIIRSTDQGSTWIPVSPWQVQNSGDSRGICVVNDNIIFVLDYPGNIWTTFNSGGDSVSLFSFLPSSLFVSDTISCDSLTRSIAFNRLGCLAPSVSSFSLAGAGSANYRAFNLSSDSISVTLYGVKSGNQNAQLILRLDNGSSDTVSLAGYVNNSPVVLTLSTQNVQTDTLGATAQVPITLNGLERAENLELVLHYDGTVDYLGSFSPSGVRLDIPGDSSSGRSVLSITGATSGAILGYAKFNVFNDSNEDAHATFDSVTVLTQTSPCEYSLPAPVTSTITTLSGCAIPILSQLIHLGLDPVLSIVPNPTNSNVWISSATDLGAVTIEIYDMLGIQQSDITRQINENAPIELQLPERSGVYNIVVRSNFGTRTLRVVREN